MFDWVPLLGVKKELEEGENVHWFLKKELLSLR